MPIGTFWVICQQIGLFAGQEAELELRLAARDFSFSLLCHKQRKRFCQTAFSIPFESTRIEGGDDFIVQNTADPVYDVEIS